MNKQLHEKINCFAELLHKNREKKVFEKTSEIFEDNYCTILYLNTFDAYHIHITIFDRYILYFDNFSVEYAKKITIKDLITLIDTYINELKDDNNRDDEK